MSNSANGKNLFSYTYHLFNQLSYQPNVFTLYRLLEILFTLPMVIPIVNSPYRRFDLSSIWSLVFIPNLTSSPLNFPSA